MALKDWINPIAAGVGAVASLGTSLINRHSQKETNKSNARINEANNQFNAEQAELQRKWSAEQAEEARKFDTSERLAQQEWQEKMADPRLQMRKWLDAGLSPVTFEGDLSVGSASGSSVGMPSGASASAASPIAMRPVGMDLDLSQTALNMAQAKAINDQNNRENQKQGLVLETAKLQVEVLDSQVDLNKALTESEKQKIEESGKRIEQLDSEIAHNQVVTHLAELEGKEKEAYLLRIQETIELELSQKRQTLNLTKEQIRELSSQITLNFANAGLAQSNANLADQNTANLSQVHFLNGIQVSAMQGHERELGKLIWNDTKGSYQLNILNSGKERRKAWFRNVGGTANKLLDTCEILGESVGSGLKGLVRISMPK